MVVLQLLEQTTPVIQALAATLLISIGPLLILQVLIGIRKITNHGQQQRQGQRQSQSQSQPIQPARGNENNLSSLGISPMFLRVFVAFAIGALLGDAFLHLIPHSFQSHSDSHLHSHSHFDYHSHSPRQDSSSSSTSSAAFSESLFDSTHCSGKHDHPSDFHHQASHNYDHDHDNAAGYLILSGMFMFFVIEKLARSRNQHSSDKALKHKKDDDYPVASQPDQQHVHGHSHNHSHSSGPARNASDYAGVLNLIADVLHNFTDGLAICASFAESPTAGIATTVAVFFHEIPHELGDIAILLQSGYTTSQAMMIQLITAIGAIAGVLLVGYLESTTMAASISPFAAGGFIYVGLVTVLPTLLEVNDSLWHTIAEIAAMLGGVMLMASIDH